MSEEMQTDAPEIGTDGTQTEPPAAEPIADSPVKDWEAEAKKWQAMSRETEKKAATNAKRLREIEERDMSELDLAKKQAAETAAELAEIRRQNVLLSKGISADLTPPPPAAGPDDWAAYADRLLAWRGTIPSAAPTALPQPRPDRSQGATPIDGAAAEEAAYQAIAGLNWPHMTNNRK